MSLLPSAASPSLFTNINAAQTVLGLPFLIALVTLQVECRLPSKYVVKKGGERSLYGGDRSYSGRLMLEPSLSRKEAYRGRRRRKRRPMTTYVSSYGGYQKRVRSRPRRPAPQVQEYPPEFDDLGEDSIYTEERPIRSRPWSNHLYSASIRSREPSRSPRPDYYPKNRGKKPRPLPIGGYNYHSREPEELDNRWNEFRDDYPPRHSDWELDEPMWEQDRVRNPMRDEYVTYNGDLSWRENRDGGMRHQAIKNSMYNADIRETLQSQNMPAYQVWSEDPGTQDDIEVQVKYPVWMEEPKGEKWTEPLYPGQRIKQKQQDNGRVGKQRPGINQDLTTHVLQPTKNKNKFRSGIGQNIRGQTKEINWELESPYQNPKVPDNNWDEPKPFENSEIIWSEQKTPKNFPWNPKKGSVKLSNKEEQIDDQTSYNRDYSWDESSSGSNQEQWPESSTSPSQSYPYWDNSQQYYHDRSLRQQPVAQSKMDVPHDGDHDHLDSTHDQKDLESKK